MYVCVYVCMYVGVYVCMLACILFCSARPVYTFSDNRKSAPSQHGPPPSIKVKLQLCDKINQQRLQQAWRASDQISHIMQVKGKKNTCAYVHTKIYIYIYIRHHALCRYWRMRPSSGTLLRMSPSGCLRRSIEILFRVSLSSPSSLKVRKSQFYNGFGDIFSENLNFTSPASPHPL